METNFSITYENRLVAFIDVMGFKELLASGNKKQLELYYQTVNDFFEKRVEDYKLIAPEDQFNKLLVSDSAILSVKLSESTDENIERAGLFFGIIAELQFTLATKALIWTRGAVSAGSLFIDDTRDVWVGPAYVRAYELEKLADYPRVIIDPNILGVFGMPAKEFISMVNHPIYRCRLMGVDLPVRTSIRPFLNDAIQIDWFVHALDREAGSLGAFFADIRARQILNQPLFEKSNKLIRYLVESVLVSGDQKDHPNPDAEKKAWEIYAELNALL